MNLNKVIMLSIFLFTVSSCSTIPEFERGDVPEEYVSIILDEIDLTDSSCSPNITKLIECTDNRYGVPQDYYCVLALQGHDTLESSRDFIYSVGVRDNEAGVFGKLLSINISGEVELITVVSGCPY
ncbi:hypothetical protein CW740_05525 [Kangiella profundi]|uniref:Uncharacterized protein n=1 Tax=Kangiella profundi TaxID=1561924 RepID=A0A2K9B1F4_9GAMM|nr:hypothetical protein [Kangiella profundi]AUD78738.1 hypothetical protein CW740_05525 [Kangiella profundi]GGE89872.1 hypothetical protein GCM10011356_00100 [Kangiella profundi]